MKTIFLLKKSYPDMVEIISKKNNINTTYSYQSYEEFCAEYKHLLAISKSPEYDRVAMFISPPKCRMIWFEGSTKIGTGGWVNLKDCSDILFYELDEETQTEIFEDYFSCYLTLDNKYIKRALTDESYENKLSCYEHNLDMAQSGDKILRFLVNDYLFSFYNQSNINLDYFSKHFLTNKQLAFIAKKYELEKYILCDKNKLNNTILSRSVKAIVYAIYLIENNLNKLKNIIRYFIEITDCCEQNIPKIRDLYQTLATHLKSINKYDVCEYISFEEVEKIINKKLDYQFFFYTNFFIDFGYKITNVDFKNKLIYLDISYW